MNKTMLLILIFSSSIFAATFTRKDTAQNHARDLMADKGCIRTQSIMRSGDEYRVTEDADGRLWVSGGRIEIVCAEYAKKSYLIKWVKSGQATEIYMISNDVPVFITSTELDYAVLKGLTTGTYALRSVDGEMISEFSESFELTF